MKKRIFAFAIALVAVVGLAGCKPEATSSSSSVVESSSTESAETTSVYTTPDLGGATLDVCINYYSSSTSMGITYQKTTPYLNLDGVTYSQNDLLPTWKQFGTNLNCSFRDAADYSKTSNNLQHGAIYTTPKAAEQPVFVNGTQQVDLYFNSSSNMSDAASQGDVAAITDHLQYMPNLTAFFQQNPSVYNQLKAADGKVYIAPYFDGLNTIEKMFIMNTKMVTDLLDAASPTYDTTTTITTAYTKSITYAANQKIPVVGTDGNATDITVNIASNIIDQQNALATKDGANLTTTLKAYLNATYGQYIGSGKLYEKLSDIYTSASACYNTDELIALMRCVKANPVYLTGGSTINVLFPRETNAANRIENIMQFATAFGIQGLTAESDRLYFDADGELQDARTTTASYTALTKLHSIYSEGLIVSDFASTTKTKYSSVSFTDGTGFMVYDYNATNTVYNATDVNGNGTASALSTNRIMPVLSPVTYWANDDHTTYKFTRHTEDARALKDGGWCVPANSDEKINAFKLMDYMFSTEGANLQDYGPASFVDGTITVAGETYPKIAAGVFAQITSTGAGWNNYYRIYVGSTQGLGHVRSNGLDYQVTNIYGREGLAKVKTAISAGVMSCALTYGDNGFNKVVPTFWSLSASEKTAATANISTLTTFWAQQKGFVGQNAVIQSGYASGQLETLLGLADTSNTEYLAVYRSNLESMDY